ncbi:PREDICTED: uncharacterized protein LOC109360437 isoform X2 [Lupinus angustifolius]|uniref:uncharacterized protein LOC109360437 isoform X2 n=1 Tax=Lupinus angustifolius TaxID=3871 RepID=UPI00092EA5AF|nr:PREDICTED: uncharacterized protein LOC109360437 isoform X2 [Lupinus angustifolius]
MNVEVQQRKFKMLKDFLSENPNSCSSNGFKSLPRKPNHTNNNNNNNLIESMRKNQNPSSINYYSPFQKLINTITTISFFTAVKKSPSIKFLPRRLSSSSRSRKRNQSFSNESCTVKIKDIIRWKSFRDIVEQQPPLSSPPLDFHRNVMGSTTTTTTTTCSCSSGSSWCGSDFTSGYLSSWEAQNDNVVVGKELVEPAIGMTECTAEVGAKEDLTCLEYEQHSPVSVLQVGEDEFSSFDQNLANIQRRKQKFKQKVQRFEFLAKLDDENSSYDEKVEEQNLVKEKARKLLHYLKVTYSMQSFEDYFLDTLLLDFFMEELSARRNEIGNDEEFECEILRKAEEWLNGSFAYDIEHVNKDTYIKDMDKKINWSIFEEGKEELALEIERAILHSLVADLLNING